jgi:signal peptidase I
MSQVPVVTDDNELGDSFDAPLPEPNRGVGRAVREWVAVIAVALGVALLIRGFAIAPFYIPSNSMYDTLHTKDRILVNKLSYRLHDVRRGDVVVFETPPGVNFGDSRIKDLIKRVIGLPGDVIEIHDCNVYVNGQRLEEPYANGACTEPASPELDQDGDGRIVVPAKSYFVMGDNREPQQSYDSRFWGFVAEDLIVGRAFVVILPFGHWQWL